MVPSIALREMIDRLVGDRGTVCLSVAIGSPAQRETVWSPRAFDQEPGFLGYSITKTFTSALMLLLQEEGSVSLDTPLARWVPRVPESEHISLRQLLNHTAGIPDYGALRSYHAAVRSSPTKPWSLRRFAAETFEQGLAFGPGTDWAYSNPGYMLLKGIAEELTGETFATLISQRIANPLGLDRTFVAERPEDLLSLAAAPSILLAADGRPTDTRKAYHPGWVAHGVVASTPSEVVQFLGAVSCGRLLSARSLAEMTKFVSIPKRFVPAAETSVGWQRPSYGLGLMGDPASPWGPLWGHNGGGPGYNASAFHAPDLAGRAVTACAMCAIEDGSIAESLVRAALSFARDS